MAETLTGTVVRWEVRGWGFIRPDGGKLNVFVHYTGVVKRDEGERVDLEIGQRVEYELSENPKGPIAINVRRV